jgi:hypothetical protein
MTGPTLEEQEKQKKKVNDLVAAQQLSSSDEEEEEEEDHSDQEDYEVEDENFDWYNDSTLQKDTYFVLVNCDRRTVKKGEQIFYCYGKRSNAFLLVK